MDSVSNEIRGLTRRGAGFLDNDTPAFETVDHIVARADEKGSWFADTEGNILCLRERLTHQALILGR